jgi:cyclo(L-tyrosyl-L-tyrosyl) synthase
MQVQGVTASCSRLWERGATALIGISPFNSYFDEERLRRLMAFCRDGGREILLFVPDEVTRYTLEAQGYPPERATKKMRRQVQYLRNKITRAANGEPPPVLGCAELARRPAYLRRHGELLQRFESDAAFRRGCLDTTRWVLASSPEDDVDERAMHLGVRYLLAELPMFLHAPEIVGHDAVAFVYRQCPAFVRSLYRGEHGGLRAAGQGFVEIADG